MKRIAQFVAIGTVLGIILSAAFIAVPWFPTESSQQAKNDYPLFIAITYVSFVIFAIVLVGMAYSLWKFRRRGPSDLRDGDPTHGNTLLELSWTAAALIVVLFFATWGAKTLDDNEAHAANGRVITVIGYSFSFEYRYDSDGGFIRNDGLYVPVGQPITMHMITPLFTPGTKDLEVIHGFWVPEWGVKQDATPGVVGKTVGTTYVTPTRIGTYEVQCTELCGSGHGEMHFKNIHVLSQADFDKWLTGAKAEAAKAKAQATQTPGLAVFNNAGCSGCHTFTPAKASGTTGPSLDDVTPDFNRAKSEGKTKATDLAGFIKESIVDPNAYVAKGFAPGIMPKTFGSSLSKKQIDDLVAYLAKGGSG
ncbi:MAG: cytochrome c oxidase subunit [Gaiellales bacterium]|jgi:cytochrome c oxidase subunit 2|nr:cytochrome c oxidase subunit [Gaiellales bacterium]